MDTGGGEVLLSLREFMPDKMTATEGCAPNFELAMAKYAPLLREAGMEIADAREWDGRLKFADVGAVVYYLKAIPWEVPGFGVRTHFERLIALQERLEAEGELSFYAGKFLIEARK